MQNLYLKTIIKNKAPILLNTLDIDLIYQLLIMSYVVNKWTVLTKGTIIL